ncbi:hypothetical protein ACFVXE_31695 [Streptomyces sp. NPDC058231]|uniref:hypothetical protein n=1 Tax=Streptomyces sp. NPDC058231 TaxID=3346392 RepID=UPI0036EB6AA5
MDDRGAEAAWHVLEGVPAGQEEIPGLLRGLVTIGNRRGAWQRLAEKLGWQTDEPRFAHAAARLFTLLPELDRRRRVQVLEFLAQRGHNACRSSVGVHHLTYTVFADGARHVVPFVADRSAAVRTRAAWLLREIPDDAPTALAALRRQAAVESDPTALVSQLLAVRRFVASGDSGAAELVAWPRNCAGRRGRR